MSLTAHRHLTPIDLDDLPLQIGQVRIAVEASSLCPTDHKKWDDAALVERLAGRPLVLGHEFAGVVLEIADNVRSVRVGDRVAVDPVIRCGRCTACVSGHPEFCSELLGIGAAAGDPVACADLLATQGIGGGFAERVVVPATNCLSLPDGVDLDAGALVEPLADVVHSVESAHLLPGQTAAVVGLGPMGLLHLDVLQAQRIATVGVDLRQDRLDGARALTGDVVLPDALGTVDVVFVTAGGAGHAPSALLALERIAPGGHVVLFSSGPRGDMLTVDGNRLHYRRQSLTGVVGFDPEHARTAIDLLASGAIHVDLIRRPRTPLADLDVALRLISAPGVLKTAIEF